MTECRLHVIMYTSWKCLLAILSFHVITRALRPKQSSWITSSNTIIELCVFSGLLRLRLAMTVSRLIVECTYHGSVSRQSSHFTSLRGPFARSNPVELPLPILSLLCVFFLDCFACGSQWRSVGYTLNAHIMEMPAGNPVVSCHCKGFSRSNPVELPLPIVSSHCAVLCNSLKL
jgi:hypothetical protein